MDDGCQQHRYETPKDYFRHQYFESCDLLIQELEERFDQQQLLPPVLSLESLLLKATNGETYEGDLQALNTSCYKDDINFDNLQKQLPLCVELVRQALPTVKQVTSVRTICEAMNSNPVYKLLFCEVHNLLRLYWTVPITTCTSERSFSALRRLLTYLRSTMSELRLNNCILLHVHKALTDSLDIKQIAKEFVSHKPERKHYFGIFND